MPSEWTEIREAKPPTDGKYLVFCPSAAPDHPLIALAWYHPEDEAWSLLPGVWIEAITHWMPLPEPPRNRRPANKAGGP